ncbi:hypothetical protein [Salipiger mucosus]|uniref:Uncharacterized protein n=1 Tax=Salipiger mucosus DSM 16094 TaxID=1123237 RepID=S9QDH1_9RHOB|nr:hypothetical protein [Salipiger mucosus]EPX77972.1 hypothetical protein Salmuc_03294 [Salipiger mucosus DSM 16094]
MADGIERVENMDGEIYHLGQDVVHTDGWTGKIIEIVAPRENNINPILLRVEPDDMSQLRGQDRERPLNEVAAAQAGRPTSCRPRDMGLSMGNFTPLAPELDATVDDEPAAPSVTP